jgi:hypothetical protein
MATLTAHRAKHVAALAANTADTVTLDTPGDFIEVINRTAVGGSGAADIMVNAYGAAATVGGDDCVIVPSGTAVVIPAPKEPNVVSVISTGTPAYSVAVIQGDPLKVRRTGL